MRIKNIYYYILTIFIKIQIARNNAKIENLKNRLKK